eukprot:TRINITY_DN9704_c0_g1_i1.p1 TRINITY_DN9704_c0_g1~~TRINITY_DN9704_c0_g1_i1.p1  ORF type:complete len:130 (-),score=31.21 TRINITY_DN9704_c0_g1_i1:88-447(-)
MSVADRGRTITNSLNTGNSKAALKAVVTNPPYGLDENSRKEDLKNVISALSSFKKDEQIIEGLESLSEDEVDVIMKYIYAALSIPDKNDSLLKWHELTLKRAGGLGCITRVLADKQNKL